GRSPRPAESAGMPEHRAASGLAPVSLWDRTRRIHMSMNRTSRLIVSCGGAALLVVAAGVVIVGTTSRREPGEPTKQAAPFIPAGQIEAGSGAVPAGPVAIPDPVQGSIVDHLVTESLVLQPGETDDGKGETFFKDGDYTSAS